MIEYEKLKKSLSHLENQFDNYSGMNEREYLSDLDKEGIKESVIQRFETCYDILWKHLKKYLEEEMGLIPPSSPKPIFRRAFENKIIDNIDGWLEYANARVATSHDYSEEKSSHTLELVENFIRDAIELYEKMTDESW